MAEALGESMEKVLWDSEGLSRSTTPRSAADDSVMDGSMMRVSSTMLQSTPLSERLPSLPSLLSSAIKPGKEPAKVVPLIDDPDETADAIGKFGKTAREYKCQHTPAHRLPSKPPRRSLLHRLSLIAEKSFNSTPRKSLKDRTHEGRQEEPQQTSPPPAKLDDINYTDRSTETTLTEEHIGDGQDHSAVDGSSELADFNNNKTSITGECFPADSAPALTTRGVRADANERESEANPGKRMPSKDSCTCQNCQDILAQDLSVDVPSEVSCSLASLESHNARSVCQSSFSHEEDPGEYQNFSDRQSAYRLALPTPDVPEGRLSQISLQLHRNLKRRKSDGTSEKVSVTSETSASPSSKRSFWTSKKSAVTPQITGTINVPQLLKRPGRISISNDEYGLRPGYCDTPPSFLLPDKDSDVLNASINSIMIVLMPSGTAEPNDPDSRAWTNSAHGGDDGGDSQRQIVVRDPLLKDLLEELKQVMVDQEMILKQSSKALDECGRLMGQANANQGIVLAEQMLHVALQRYFAAEGELQWYIDGGEFEPQRDSIVIRELKIRFLEEFRANVAASKDQFVFLVLLKVGHRVEASDVLWMGPEDREIVVKGRWSHGIFKGPGGKPNFRLGANSPVRSKARRRSFNFWNTEETPEVQKSKDSPKECEAAEDFEFDFNRSNWKVDIEIYSFFLKRPRWESSLALNKIARKLEQVRSTTSPSTRRRNIRGESDRHIEVRKSSFGLLARATLSKDDVLARRRVTLVACLNPSPFESQLTIVGEARLNDDVHYTALLNVKDHTGFFGRQGGMRTFVGKLSNTVLSFFERCPSPQDEVKPVRIFDLSSLSEDCIEMDTVEGLFFHSFTLWLRNDTGTYGSASDQRDEDVVLHKPALPSPSERWSSEPHLTCEDVVESESIMSDISEESSSTALAGASQQASEHCLRLCTNSRKQTLLWVEHLRRALRQARIVELV
ncbi:hypothetical protein BIW11_12517 [Tropilaelaps mercedesae]|uniref:PH domain-containing protein n=1 Tax=Tropilaelaps mercedesae TaxID=418985 RepID=A0A1V9X6Q4_9ACAR|nr:hypothetical protein BIW11_12517 [Tropilaelaps mercedesae]